MHLQNPKRLIRCCTLFFRVGDATYDNLSLSLKKMSCLLTCCYLSQLPACMHATYHIHRYFQIPVTRPIVGYQTIKFPLDYTVTVSREVNRVLGKDSEYILLLVLGNYLPHDVAHKWRRQLTLKLSGATKKKYHVI